MTLRRARRVYLEKSRVITDCVRKYLDVDKLIFNETSLYLRVQLKQSFQFEKLTESLKEESVRLMPYQSENEIGLSFSGIGIEKIQDGIKIIAKAIGKAK